VITKANKPAYIATTDGLIFGIALARRLVGVGTLLASFDPELKLGLI